MSRADRLIRTFSGGLFDPFEPRAKDIRIQDIAHHLSNLCRFTGASRRFYSVAEHCVRASHLVKPPHEFATLMHDATEAYINDLSTPVKHHRKMFNYRQLESKIGLAVGEAFEIDWMAHGATIKLADAIMYWTECRDLMRDVEIPQGQVVCTERIVPWSPDVAKAEFLRRFFFLTSLG